MRSGPAVTEPGGWRPGLPWKRYLGDSQAHYSPEITCVTVCAWGGGGVCGVCVCVYVCGGGGGGPGMKHTLVVHTSI